MICLQQLVVLMLISACPQGCRAYRQHHRSNIASGINPDNSNSHEPANNISRNASEPCTGLKSVPGLNCTAVAGQPVLVPSSGGQFSFWTRTSPQCLPAYGKMILHLDPCERCRMVTGPAFYHRFHDCILPSWAAFMAAVEAASGPARGGLVVVLPHRAFFANYYRPFLDNTTDFIFGDHAASPDGHRNQVPCFVGAKAVATLRFELNEMAFLAGGANAPLLVDSHVRVWNLPECSSINVSKVIVLQRDRTRIIQNLDEIIDNITRATGHTPYVHRGKESWRQNLEMFRCADVLLGYHGAGQIFGTFMRAGTTVIELTTTIPLNNTQGNEAPRESWRSNVGGLRPSYPHVGWVRLIIPWEDLKAALPDRPNAFDPDDFDHRVKNVLQVTVPATYFSTISDMVRNAVNIWGPHTKQGQEQL